MNSLEHCQSSPVTPALFFWPCSKPQLLQGVYALGFNRPSKIQETALPMMLAEPYVDANWCPVPNDLNRCNLTSMLTCCSLECLRVCIVARSVSICSLWDFLLSYHGLCSPQNLIAQSQSGTGKTAAFVLAMLSHVDPNKKYPQVGFTPWDVNIC